MIPHLSSLVLKGARVDTGVWEEGVHNMVSEIAHSFDKKVIIVDG